jgi:thiamine kinase-like enzyme
MFFTLSSHNAHDYLVSCGLRDRDSSSPSSIEPLAAKNFNLLLTFTENDKLLIKQERRASDGEVAGEFLDEWRVQEFLNRFPELGYLKQSLPEVLHFDREQSILVFRYLTDYQDLSNFYDKEKNYGLEIVAALGSLLGNIHRDTFNHQNYQNHFSEGTDSPSTSQIRRLTQALNQLGPEIFGTAPPEGIRFLTMYQRYDSLGKAISQLENTFCPVCLTHNDLKLNNILLHNNWPNSDEPMIRLIDWERSAWGDPAVDLGTLIGSYLQNWLGSLVISKSLSLEESLQLAMTPLPKIQPSIAALTQAYLQTFPQILEYQPDFLLRVIQFAGFALIQQIQAMIQYQKSFGNTGIAMLQVAKTLLCSPERSLPTVFGIATPRILQQCSAIP